VVSQNFVYVVYCWCINKLFIDVFGQLEINIEELIVSDPWLLSLLLVDYKANNPDAVCSR